MSITAKPTARKAQYIAQLTIALARKAEVDAIISAAVDAGTIPSGWLLAYGSLSDVYRDKAMSRALDEMRAVSSLGYSDSKFTSHALDTYALNTHQNMLRALTAAAEGEHNALAEALQAAICREHDAQAIWAANRAAVHARLDALSDEAEEAPQAEPLTLQGEGGAVLTAEEAAQALIRGRDVTLFTQVRGQAVGIASLRRDPQAQTYVLSSRLTGDHALAIRSTDAARLAAHIRGFVTNQGPALAAAPRGAVTGCILTGWAGAYTEFTTCPAWVSGAPVPGSDVLAWSGQGPQAGEPPAIGDRVLATLNGLGRGVVRGYFREHGWLGVLVEFEAPPAWYVRQNGAQAIGHLFGTEVKVIRPEPAADLANACAIMRRPAPAARVEA